jgi:hypothetical protein
MATSAEHARLKLDCAVLEAKLVRLDAWARHNMAVVDEWEALFAAVRQRIEAQERMQKPAGRLNQMPRPAGGG